MMRLWLVLAMHRAMYASAATADADAIASGMRPHHNAGSTTQDPLVFKHRFQHHDPISKRLLYYQYEARRHAHVIMLADLDVQSCTAKPTELNGNLSIVFSLEMPSQKLGTANITQGSIVVGENMDCVLPEDDEPDNTIWRKHLRDRVIAEPRVVAARGTILQ